MTPIPAAQQINQLRDQLLAAYTKRQDAEQQLKEADDTIKAIRNVLAGVPLGQKVQDEIQAERVQATTQ